MNRRPSRVIIALARWALMAGLAGIVLAALAFLDRLRAPENIESQYNLFVVAAVLLSLSFVLAPFVRRAFGVVLESQQPSKRKTLLDEMRERPEGEWAKATEAAPPVPPQPSPRSALTRIIVALYVVFGAVLIAVIFALQ